MTSYQKLKWKYEILMDRFQNIETYVREMKNIKTMDDLEEEWNGETPDRLEIIKSMTESILLDIDAAYKELWKADNAK